MEVRKAGENDLDDLAKVYKAAFRVHNVFRKSEEEIVEYLKKFLGRILVAVEDGKIVGGVVVSEKKQNEDWTRYRLMHVAVAPEWQMKGIGTALLEAAEATIKRGKIEVTVSPKVSDPERMLAFYEKNGYKKEGELRAHYRPDEPCFVLGKVVK